MKGKNRELTKIQSISRAVRTRQRESARTREGGRERECRRAKSTAEQQSREVRKIFGKGISQREGPNLNFCNNVKKEV